MNVNVLGNKFIRFVAVAFPGGYKFFAVMLITNFSTDITASLFSEGFFWILLYLTFSGIPVAAIMSSRDEFLTNKDKYLVVIISTALCLLVSSFVSESFTDFSFFLNIAFAAIFISIYEFVRKDFFNDECFVELFVSGCISILLLLILFFWFESGHKYILLSSMFCLLAPAWVLHFIKYHGSIIRPNAEIKFKRLFIVFIQYCISNGCSTSMAAIIPLLLVAEMGAEFSIVMAQVVAFSKMLLLVPKAMAASNIPRLRKNGSSWTIVKPYCNVLKLYFFSLAAISAPLSWFYDSDNAFLFYLLLLSIQVSQLALPYSNVLAVEGKSKELLIANIKGTIIFILTLLPIYLLLEQGYERGFTVLAAFFLHNFIKFELTKSASIEFIK